MKSFRTYSVFLIVLTIYTSSFSQAQDGHGFRFGYIPGYFLKPFRNTQIEAYKLNQQYPDASNKMKLPNTHGGWYYGYTYTTDNLVLEFGISNKFQKDKLKYTINNVDSVWMMKYRENTIHGGWAFMAGENVRIGMLIDVNYFALRMVNVAADEFKDAAFPKYYQASPQGIGMTYYYDYSFPIVGETVYIHARPYISWNYSMEFPYRSQNHLTYYYNLADVGISIQISLGGY